MKQPDTMKNQFNIYFVGKSRSEFKLQFAVFDREARRKHTLKA